MGTEILEEATSVQTEVAIPEETFRVPEGIKIADLQMP
jgi:hypothetical protein